MPLGIKPYVDFAFKKIFGSPENKIALIGLLNAILRLATPIRDVEILNPFSYQEFVDDKLIVLDVCATDDSGRLIDIEMQVSVHSNLLQRLSYYACKQYVAQILSGGDYLNVRPSLTICLLTNDLFRDSDQAHHRFQMVDLESRRELDNSIEVHTVELGKYELSESTISDAQPVQQWAFFLLFADEYDAEQLRKLLPKIEFQQAIMACERISLKTKDKAMYDQREKAQRDYQWAIAGARQDGKAEGRAEGLAEGEAKGKAIGRVRILQEFLELPPTSLDGLSLADLASLESDLKRQLRSRN